MAEDIEDTVLDALAVLQTVPRTEEEVPSTTRELEDVPEKEDEEKAEDREGVTYESEDGAGELEEAVAATKEEEGDAASKAVDWLSFLISYKHFFQPCTKCAPERMPYGRKRANVVRYCADQPCRLVPALPGGARRPPHPADQEGQQSGYG